MLNSEPTVAGSANISESDILCAIAQKYDLDEQCSEEITPKLATIVNKMVRTRLNDDKLREKLGQYTRPTNCENILGTKITPEIWPKIESVTRSRGIKLQGLKNILIKAIIPLVKVTNRLMLPDPKLHDNSKSIIKSVMDSIALLVHANCELIQRRRDLIRPDLNNQ